MSIVYGLIYNPNNPLLYLRQYVLGLMDTLIPRLKYNIAYMDKQENNIVLTTLI
jgi:hypothetical protein